MGTGESLNFEWASNDIRMGRHWAQLGRRCDRGRWESVMGWVPGPCWESVMGALGLFDSLILKYFMWSVVSGTVCVIQR